MRAKAKTESSRTALASMTKDAAHSGRRPRSSLRRIGCSVIVMTKAMKTGPTMSAMDLTPARAIVRAAIPNSKLAANDLARGPLRGVRGGMLHGILLSPAVPDGSNCSRERRHRVMSRPWAVSAQMMKMSTAMMSIDQNG